MSISAPPADGRRETRKRETRSRILGAAVELFQQRGYGQTSLAQIAKRSAVAPRTVSNYFPLKVDLLVAYRAEMLAVVEQVLADRLDLEPVQRVRAALLASARENQRQPNGRLVQKLLAEHASYEAIRGIRLRFEDDVRRALEGARLRPGTDLEVAVLALVAGHLTLLQRWSRHQGGSLVQAVETLFRQWSRGVLQP